MRRLLAAVIAPLTLLSVPAVAQLPVPEPPRSWKTAEGQAFPATLLTFDGTTAVLRMANGQPAKAPLAKLSGDDQQYLADWLKKQPIKVVMPESVGVDTAQVKAEIVSEDAANEKYVYRTQHFEFESQGKFTQSLLREVGRNFEATYELCRALPWGIEPKAPSGDYFKARLLKDMNAYHSAGGPPNSGGVYMSKIETFLVPFDSIGVKVVGKSYTKDENFETHTMVHELTHQMMHFWLQLLPQWLVEGSAEYTGTLPLHAGKFRVSGAKTGLKDYTEFLKKRAVGGMPEPYPLEQLFNISNEQWNYTLSQDPTSSRRLYFTSYLLVYYFMHLDGKGDGERMVRYFREIGESRKGMTDYEKAMAEFLKKPGVTKLGGGRISYPSTLTPPQAPTAFASPQAGEELRKKAMQILLDGRSEAELMKQIRSAYTKLGIRL